MADVVRLTPENGGELARPSLCPRKTPDSADVALESVGQELRKARQRWGKELSDVWRVLKIRADYLIAIEEGRFEALPGRLYAIGYVRSYAAYLGLDAEEFVHRLKVEMAGPDASEPVIGLSPPPERKPAQGDVLALPERKPAQGGPLASPERKLAQGGLSALSEHRLPQGGAVIAGLMVAVMVYYGYYVFASTQRMGPPPVIPVPARLANEAGLGQERAAAPRLATVREPAPSLSPEPAPARSIDVAPEQPVTVPPASVEQPTPQLPAEPTPPPPPIEIEAAPTQPVSVAVLVPAEPRTAEPAPRLKAPPPPPGRGRSDIRNSKSRITLRVHRATRVAVQGGKRVFIDRTLSAGATYRVPNMAGLRLVARDAGAVEVILDGISVGFAGRNGVTARGLSLTPQNVINLRQPG